MAVRCLLWDFGDTLYDELSLWRGSLEWMDIYHSFDDEGGIGAAWSLGQLDTAEVATRMARQSSLPEAEILRHLSRTDLFEPFPFTHGYYSAKHLPQAIVTVNPTDFRTLATKLGLDHAAVAIVISAEERSVDKGHLCTLALERMGGSYSPSEALLIDNKSDNLDAWEHMGGIGYHYMDDAIFEADVAHGVENLIRPQGGMGHDGD